MQNPSQRVMVSMGEIRIPQTVVGPAVLRMAQSMMRGQSMEPIHLRRRPAKGYSVTDGKSRFLAHRLLGLKQIRAIIEE